MRIQFIPLLVLFTVFCAHIGSAQNAGVQDWLHLIEKEDPDFFDIQHAFNSFYKDRGFNPGADDEFVRFKRWEQFLEPRIGPTGKFYDPALLYRASRSLEKKQSSSQKTDGGNWTSMGPNNPGWGRVNCITIDPNNDQVYWMGTPGGGIWKSTDAGSNWVEKTGSLPTLSIANIVVDHSNSNTIYIATGDHYGYQPSGWPWFAGGTYSMGIMKSTDGGSTWNTTGMSHTFPQKIIIRRLIMDPDNNNILIAGTNQGIFRTTDGGASWNQHKHGNIYDVEFHAGNRNVLIAVTDSVFRSADNGLSWSRVSNSPIFQQNTFYRRVSVAVTPADTAKVWVMRSELNDSGIMYLSTDGGQNFNQINSSGTTFYGYWDNVIEVSPIDANRIVCGGANIEYSPDGGTTWNSMSTGYVDHHDATFLPDGSGVLLANDGGLFKSTYSSYTNLTYGLELTQFYAIGLSATDPNIVYGGVQDRGTLQLINGVWDRVLPNDGAESVVDHSDPNIVYSSWQYGNFRKTTDGGVTWNPITPGTGSWTAPMVMHPTNNQILYYGGNAGVSKSVDAGSTWNSISSGQVSGQIISLSVAKSNPNYIYAATYYSIWRTTDGGTNWTNISSGLPTPTNAISYIAISGNDPDRAYVSLSGFVSGEKVYMTTTGGSTWSNYSTGIDNIPANCIVYDDGSPNHGVYVGTDIGVYHRDSAASTWTYWNSGLPRVIIDELEIHYGTAKLRAGTHGRGLWESPLNVVTGRIKPATDQPILSIYPNPSEGKFLIDLELPQSGIVTIEVFDLNGKLVFSTNEEVVEFRQFSIDLMTQPGGTYILKCKTRKHQQTQKLFKH